MAARGRPFQPGNKFGKGRPPGSKNKTTTAVQQLLDNFAEPIMRKAIATALQGGEPAVLRALLDRVAPVRREAPVKLGSLPMDTTTDLMKASETVLKKTASGEITITEGKGLAELIEGHREAIAFHKLDERVQALEARG